MKKSLILVGLLSIGYAHAQYEEKVGINTEQPSATLNVKSKTGSTETTKNLELQNANGKELVTVLDNGKVGINNASPEYLLDLYSLADDKYTSNGIALRAFRNNAGASSLNFYRARGTKSAPLAVQTRDGLSGMYFIPYTGSKYVTSASISGEVSGNVTNDKVPTSIDFNLVYQEANKPDRMTQVMRIFHNGHIGIGMIEPKAPLHIVANNGFNTWTDAERQRAKKDVILIDAQNGVDGHDTNKERRVSISSSMYRYQPNYRGHSIDFGLFDLQNGAKPFMAFSVSPEENYPSNQDMTVEHMRIMYTGNIGMGTTNPTNKLHIVATENPLKLEGLQETSDASAKNLVVVDGVVKVSNAPVGGGSQGIAQEADGVIGNEVSGVITGGGLKVDGSGTKESPLKVGVAEGGITTGMLAAGSVTGEKIANGSVTSDKLNIPGTNTGDVLVWNGTSWVAQAPQGGASLDAITGNIREVPVISKALWTAGVFGLIQTTANGYIDLPDPANYSGRIIAVNNQAGTKIEFGQNSPANYPSIEPGSGFILMSSGSKWYVIGGGI